MRGELTLNNSSLSSEKDLRQASKSDFTQGSILGKLVPFMLPILGALILQAAYGAVDLLVVGRFGTTSGLSAVSTALWLMGFLPQAISRATTPKL